MSKAWGGAGAGAWALDAERAEAEAEERERAAAAAAAAAAEPSPLVAGVADQSFPNLKEAATSSRQKKKKGVAVSLAQFNAGNYGGGGGRRDSASESRGLTPDEMLRLPTGPRERSQEELEYGRLGGGFRSYGGGGPRGGFRRDSEGDGSWGGGGEDGGRRGYGGFSDEQRRGPPGRASDFDQPSRADEVDNWGSGKKPFVPALAEGGRRDSYSSLGGGGPSRADEVDDWSTSKKSQPSRYSSFGSGFGDSRASDTDRLGRNRDGASDSDRWGRSREGLVSNDQGRPKLILDPPKKDVGASETAPARTRPSPFGSARPREEVLTEKGLNWRRMDSEIETKKTSRPTSSHSSRPSGAQSAMAVSPGSQSGSTVTEVTEKPRQKTNPFGDAKPREVLLQEKGIDWRKIDMDLDHRSVERSETDEEKILKEEINCLMELTKGTEGDGDGNFTQLSTEELSRLHEEIASKERDLELLARQLDDKVRFGQKVSANARPGSGGGRSDTSSTRPPSQSGMSDGSRNIEIIDRPRSSSGNGDAWGKPMDDRRGFQGRKDRGFFDSRNGDRSSSRGGW